MIYIGIDIGTSNCCVYAMRAGQKPEIVCSSVSGAPLTPSVVSIGAEQITIGEIAQQQQNTHPTFYEFKRVIGRVYAQKELWADAKHWPFRLGRPTHPESEAPVYHAFHKGELQSYSALQLTTMLVQQLWTDVKAIFGTENVGSTVITVPAHFDHVQRQATVDATTFIPNVILCNEPTAAAVAYVQTHPGILKNDETLLVFDLGAGTLDITVLRYDSIEYHVLESKGLCDLGGINFTQGILQRYVQHIKISNAQDIRQDKALLALARESCERAKRTLSVCEETSIVLPSLEPMKLSRSTFEQFIAPDLKRCTELLQTAYKIDHVLLVGGSSRVPAVQKLIETLLPSSVVHRDINMDQCVALGACYMAGSTQMSVTERLYHSIGIKTANKKMHVLLPRNETLPCEALQNIYPQSAKQTSVEICLYQGEEPLATDNVLLGRLRLNDISPTQPKLHLKVCIDANGVISIHVCDPDGKEAKTTIKYNGLQDGKP
jgi:molecular chaperone DnaK (HSP70)